MGKNSSQSSTYENRSHLASHKAVDGLIFSSDGHCDGFTHTVIGDLTPWWQVDLEQIYKVIQISVMWRTDAGIYYIYTKPYTKLT